MDTRKYAFISKTYRICALYGCNWRKCLPHWSLWMRVQFSFDWDIYEGVAGRLLTICMAFRRCAIDSVRRVNFECDTPSRRWSTRMVFQLNERLAYVRWIEAIYRKIHHRSCIWTFSQVFRPRLQSYFFFVVAVLFLLSIAFSLFSHTFSVIQSTEKNHFHSICPGARNRETYSYLFNYWLHFDLGIFYCFFWIDFGLG